METILNRIYTSTRNPNSFSSVQKLYRAARREIPDLTKQQVEQFLQSKLTYTLNKPVVRKFKRLKTIAAGVGTEWQADLMVFNAIARENDGYKYLLVVVDVFSRFLYLEGVKSKKADDMQKAFENIFKRSKFKAWRVTTDQGGEFCSKQMRAFWKKHDIQKAESHTHPTLHATIAERFNRTVRERLKRYFNEYATLRWIDAIQDIAYALNHSVHSTLGVRPVDVTPKNADKLWKRLYAKQKIEKPKFQVGQHVRVENTRGPFSKHQANFSDEVFVVDRVLANYSPVVYSLKDMQGEKIKGYFYSQELCVVSPETRYRVESVLRTRVRNGEKEYFVRWMGFPENHNQWIRASDLV